MTTVFLTNYTSVRVARDERKAEARADAEPKAERRPEAEQQAGDESRDRAETNGIGYAEAKSGRVSCNKLEMNASRNSLGSALLYRERAERVRVMTIATRTKPKGGAHLAPLTPLI